ncbi:hypothetical protein BGZ88_005659 [Linnemannia elongata]|nr:hypothetical protein BGZ88_005659 [Linnemannia elongata]
MGLDPEELVNPRAVAYKVPARYKVSAKAFADAAAKSLSAVINPTNGPSISKPFLSTIRHPGTEFDRIGIVYHEDLDAFKVSTTPIVFKKTMYPPLSSNTAFMVTKIMFSEYQFQTSADLGDNLCAWVKKLLEIEKPMGKVILIGIPTRTSLMAYKYLITGSLSTSRETSPPKPPDWAINTLFHTTNETRLGSTGQPMEIQTSATTARAKATSWRDLKTAMGK